jgi:hypothetical protein
LLTSMVTSSAAEAASAIEVASLMSSANGTIRSSSHSYGVRAVA